MDCKSSSSVCKSNEITRNVELKTFSLKSEVKAVIDFLKDLVDEINAEDEVIERWREPGKFFILFKIVSCKWCKKALKCFNEVKEKFADRASEIRFGMIDCKRHEDLCDRYGVIRYPRFYFFENFMDEHKVSNFTGERETPQLIEFIEQKLSE